MTRTLKAGWCPVCLRRLAVNHLGKLPLHGPRNRCCSGSHARPRLTPPPGAVTPPRPAPRRDIWSWRNPATGTWRVYIDDRIGYYCATEDEAAERMTMLRLQRERHGDGSRP